MRLLPLAGGSPVLPSSCPHGHPARALRIGFATALAVVTGLTLLAGPAAATMYKWIDKDGRVVYSDQPPPANVKTEIIKAPPPPANPNAAQELVDKELEIKMRDKKRAEEAKVAEKARAESDRRRELCAQARGLLRGLQTAGQEYLRFNEKGERVFLDEQGRRAAIEQQQLAIRDNCLN